MKPCESCDMTQFIWLAWRYPNDFKKKTQKKVEIKKKYMQNWKGKKKKSDNCS
jgi:hypothetical protein